jgi:hypothetical protein
MGCAVGSFLTNATIVPLVNDWYRISVTTTSSTSGSAGWAIWATNGDAPFSVTPSGTSGIFIWGAQLELGSTATPYQKRVNFLEVTEAGKRSIRRLYFNGTSHFMTTPVITPNTDKAQVFAGVRKLSDFETIVVELSPSVLGNAGSLYLASTSASGDYASTARGSAATVAGHVAVHTPTVNAPHTDVVTATHDIAGDLSRIRKNGVFGTDGTADKGTGNFLAYPMFIGAGWHIPILQRLPRPAYHPLRNKP